MIEVVFLDFNGVIINDEPLQMKAYQEVLQAEDIGLSEADYYGSLGMDDKTFLRAAYKRAARALDEAQMNALIERKTEAHRALIADDLPLFPGAVNFAKALSRQMGVGLVSMARRTEIDHVLERAGLLDTFHVIVSAEDVTAHKPDPQGYNLALKRFQPFMQAHGRRAIEPRFACVFEDAPPGVRAGRAAGMHVVGVSNTVSAAELRAAGAEAVTATLADWVPESVRSLFPEEERAIA